MNTLMNSKTTMKLKIKIYKISTFTTEPDCGASNSPF